MILSPPKAQRVLRLLKALDLYVNARAQLLPPLNDFTTEQRLQLRRHLYEHPQVLEQYLGENPDGLSSEDLSLVASWRDYRYDDFLVLRFTRKGAVLSQSGPTRYYQVLGLTKTLEESLGRPAPVYLRTALLPFEGRLIYDGLVSEYRFSPGPDLRRRALEEALQAEQEGKILTAFTPPRPRSRWRPVVDQILHASQKLEGPDSLFRGPALSLAQAASTMAELTQPSQEVDLEALRLQLVQARQAVARLESALKQLQA